MVEKSEHAGRKLRIEVFLVLLAVAAGLIENILPRPVPFVKPGLANIVTVAAVVKYGMGTAIRINLLRSAGASLVMGTLATPSFVLAVSGGLASAMAMGLLRRLFSVPALSVSGSLASMWIQLLTFSLLFTDFPSKNLFLPITMWGVAAGTITGIMATVLLRRGFPWISGTGVDSAPAEE
ncbi:MAG: hypothetical protein GF388_04335 [Candidatus Aegiribacteria sp.]|nr:hypothetical protein [Candidatus Aegiribacteria sp.]MBD3294467.1 hypothetical protein [Candidatus Fermentibacteria bacterium]